MTTSASHTPSARTPAEALDRARNDPAYAAFLLLRIGFTALPILMGADKFVNLLTTSPPNWEGYLAPWIAGLSPLSPVHTMMVVGVIEIIAGIAVGSKPRYASYIVAAWLAGIIIILLTWSRRGAPPPPTRPSRPHFDGRTATSPLASRKDQPP